MTIPTNPFLKTYDAVYNMLFGGTGNELAAMVSVGNRINFGSPSELNRDPVKIRPVTADLPEVRLIDEGGALNLHANSSSLSYTQSLSLVIQSGDWRYGNFCSALNWYTVVNMSKWRTELIGIGGLTWNGASIIKNIRMGVVSQIGESNPERPNSINGWSTVWRMQIDMQIPNAAITYFEV